jgi:hypothetical protein
VANELEKLSMNYIGEEVNSGNTMVQTKTEYSTALSIQRPRNLMQVVNRCEMEAALAGDDFYYSWKQGSEVIEGLSIQAAMAIARNYGNCAVDAKVQETKDSYIFTGYFIDLETGFNIARPFRQNRQSPKSKTGKEIYTGDRGADIIFQIGASKALRNVILNAMPPYITQSVIEKAKQGVVKKFETLGVVKSAAMIEKKIEALKIPKDIVERAYGVSQSWTIDKIVMIAGALKSIEDGIMRPNEAFGIPDEPVVTNEVSAEAKAKLAEAMKGKTSDYSEIKVEEVDFIDILKTELREKHNLELDKLATANDLVIDQKLAKSLLDNPALLKKYAGKAI